MFAFLSVKEMEEIVNGILLTENERQSEIIKVRTELRESLKTGEPIDLERFAGLLGKLSVLEFIEDYSITPPKKSFVKI